MSHILFVIHGVGIHSQDWSTEAGGPVETLKALAPEYKHFREHPLDVEFVQIRYDHLFDKVLESWNEQGKPLSEAFKLLPAGGSDWAKKAVLDLLGKAGDDKDAFFRIAGDVPLYAGFKFFRQFILSHVMHEIAENLAAHAGDGTHFSVMAHSLGTTVAHDALHLLGSQDWGAAFDWTDPAIREKTDRVKELQGAARKAFHPDTVRFDALFQIANTSNLLHRTKAGVYDSLVRPCGLGADKPGFFEHFYNIAHKFDPIVWPARFEVPGAWGSRGEDVSVSHFHALNIHGYSHYLKNPEVHWRILSTLDAGAELEQDEVDRWDEFLREPWRGPFAQAKHQTAAYKELDRIVAAAKTDAQETALLKRILEFVERVR